MLVLDEWATQAVLADTVIFEQRIRVLLQPKPRWLPESIWNRVLKRVLTVEVQRV